MKSADAAACGGGRRLWRRLAYLAAVVPSPTLFLPGYARRHARRRARQPTSTPTSTPSLPPLYSGSLSENNPSPCGCRRRTLCSPTPRSIASCLYLCHCSRCSALTPSPHCAMLFVPLSTGMEERARSGGAVRLGHDSPRQRGGSGRLEGVPRPVGRLGQEGHPRAAPVRSSRIPRRVRLAVGTANAQEQPRLSGEVTAFLERYLLAVYRCRMHICVID